jgi:hypothetical protein
LATEQNARTSLWKICFHLAEWEAGNGNQTAAQVLHEQARTAVDFISDHAGRDDLRTSFLALPEVQTILSNSSKSH